MPTAAQPVQSPKSEETSRPRTASRHGRRSNARRSGGSDVKVRLLRLWFAAASRVAPGLAEQQAAMLFLTPGRRTPRAPAIEGLAARRLAIEAEGRTLTGWSWGEGPTVLLVHGWSGLAADMTALAAELARAGLRAVAFDMPAHGYSPGRRTSLAEWMRVLPALAEQLGGVHAVVGHSFGATAVTLALEAGLRANGAVLIAPALGPGHFLERMRRYIGLPAARTAGMERRLVAHVGRELAFYDTSRAAAALRVPALILHDPADDEVPWAHAEALARAWRGSRLAAAAAGDGHYRILKSPHTLEQTLAFVGGLPRAAADARDVAASR